MNVKIKSKHMIAVSRFSLLHSLICVGVTAVLMYASSILDYSTFELVAQIFVAGFFAFAIAYPLHLNKAFFKTKTVKPMNIMKSLVVVFMYMLFALTQSIYFISPLLFGVFSLFQLLLSVGLFYFEYEFDNNFVLYKKKTINKK